VDESPPLPNRTADLEAAFERGDFASVRARAQAIRSEAASTDAERTAADDYLRRIEPPGAARFALWITLALVVGLSVYFAFLRPHP